MARFATVSKNELEKLLADKDAENTKKATKLAVNIFTTYLKEKKIKEPDDKESLAAVCGFGLNRQYISTRDINIINDPAFNETNKVFGAKCVELKRQGLAKVEHKQPICQEDLQKLYECGIFDISNPVTLQNKIFFEVMLYFCRRGRQNLRQLKKTDFSVMTDGKGNKYVRKITDELTKNRRENDDGLDGGIMLENSGSHCPVTSFKLYIKHLNPLSEYLFQRPKTKDIFACSQDVWYDNMVVGERSLGEKMKKISKDANLSKTYTNHSIRATAVTILDRSGFEARHIMAVSGHKNESSIRSYCKTNMSTKKEMSASLSTKCVAAGQKLPDLGHHQLSPEMSASLSTECVVAGQKLPDLGHHQLSPEMLASLSTECVVAGQKLPDLGHHQLSPVLSLSQEEFIMQNTHTENTKTFNFRNCSVSFFQ